MDEEKIALDAEKASLKLVDTDTGTIIAPPTASSASNTVTIPHNCDTTDLIWAVVASTGDIFASTRYVTTPFSTPDGRVQLIAYIDDTNLYIKATSSTAGSPEDGATFSYRYFILMP